MEQLTDFFTKARLKNVLKCKHPHHLGWNWPLPLHIAASWWNGKKFEMLPQRCKDMPTPRTKRLVHKRILQTRYDQRRMKGGLLSSCSRKLFGWCSEKTSQTPFLLYLSYSLSNWITVNTLRNFSSSLCAQMTLKPSYYLDSGNIT